MAFAKPKASSTARGYDSRHRQEAERRATQHTPASPCSDCGRPLGPQYGHTRRGRRISLWHLPHTADRSGYLPGLQHARCNLRDGARRGRARQTTTAQRM